MNNKITIKDKVHKYCCDGMFWYRNVGNFAENQLNDMQIGKMLDNTFEGHYLPDGSYEHREDIRTWRTFKQPV